MLETKKGELYTVVADFIFYAFMRLLDTRGRYSFRVFIYFVSIRKLISKLCNVFLLVRLCLKVLLLST